MHRKLRDHTPEKLPKNDKFDSTPSCFERNGWIINMSANILKLYRDWDFRQFLSQCYKCTVNLRLTAAHLSNQRFNTTQLGTRCSPLAPPHIVSSPTHTYLIHCLVCITRRWKIILLRNIPKMMKPLVGLGSNNKWKCIGERGGGAWSSSQSNWYFANIYLKVLTKNTIHGLDA